MTTLDDSRGEHLYRFRVGALEVDQARGAVLVDGDQVSLEPKPLALLLALLEQPGQVVSRSELLHRLWGREAHLSDNVLANAVMRLRRALGPGLGPLVRNVAGSGYMLDAKVERVAVGRRFESRFELAPGAPVPGRETYLLDAPLGSSPHSEVWLARHARTHDRRVFKFCSDGDRLAALKREFTLYRVLREALGERDDYARVLDANFASPPFWLECEFGGENLVDWAANGNRLAGLAPEERLALFVGVARAVADAHRVGVLHKDLKPSNVLVAPAAPAGAEAGPGAATARAWLTRVTDFGSGRLLSPELLQQLGVTQLGLTLTNAVGDSGSGTLIYLAPEIFAGAAPTVQSDLYALGLMLYQLMVGDMRRPMATGWDREIDDELLREDIAAATQGRPEERLASVAELVERLQTRRQRMEQRARERQRQREADAAQAEVKRVQARRPWLIALALALATGLGATTWAWHDAARQREAAQRAGQRAEAIQAFLSDDVLGGANPFAAKTAEPQTVKVALLKAVDRVDARFAAHPEARGAVHAALAELLQTYQAAAAANREWAKALPDLRQVYGPRDPRTVAATLRAAAGLSRAGDARGAEALFAQAESALGPAGPADAALAVLRDHVRGLLLLDQTHPLEALAALKKALALAKVSAGVPVWLLDDCYEQVSGASYLAGRYKEGIEVTSEWAVSLQARPEVPALLLASARRRLAALLMNDGRAAEAAPLLEQAVASFETGLGGNALDTLMARNDQCMRLEAVGSIEPAQQCRVALLAVADKAPDMPARLVAGMRMNLGIGYYMLKRDTDALRWLETAIESLKPLEGVDGYKQIVQYYAACAEMRLGRTAAAMTRLAGLRAAALEAAEPTVPWELRLALLRGVGLARQGDSAQARRLIEPAIARLQDSTEEEGEAVFGMARQALREMSGRAAEQ